MKMKFDAEGLRRTQPDPFIFEDGGKFYMYVSAMYESEGVEAYCADDLFGEFRYIGIVTETPGGHDFWAPSVIRYEGKYYMYTSFRAPGVNINQPLYVLSADRPEGPFKNPKRLYDEFSIDSHAVETEAGLFLWYAKDNRAHEKVGTRVYIDRLLDPYTPAYAPREVLLPDFPEEKFTPQCNENGDWYTIEGAFWFREGEWQYLMYSGGCYQDDTYHIGYAVAKSDETDLTRVDFVKHTENGAFAPVIIKNEFEEGTGHHSVIKYRGEYYAVYHGRDYGALDGGYREARTARICRLTVKDGIITAERYPDRV